MSVITRESVRQAFSVGITAAQILQFLEYNAHPQMRRRVPVIPEAVADQVRLWEAEDKRVTLESGAYYDEFATGEAFKKAEKYARDVGVLLWSDPTKMSLFVSDKGHQLMRTYIKQYLHSSK